MKKILLIVMMALALSSSTREAKDAETAPGAPHADTTVAVPDKVIIDSARLKRGADSVITPG